MNLEEAKTIRVGDIVTTSKAQIKFHRRNTPEKVAPPYGTYQGKVISTPQNFEGDICFEVETIAPFPTITSVRCVPVQSKTVGEVTKWNFDFIDLYLSLVEDTEIIL